MSSNANEENSPRSQITQIEKRNSQNDMENTHTDKKIKTSNESNDVIEFTEKNQNQNEESVKLFNGMDVNSLTKSQMKKYKKMLNWEANKKQRRKQEKLRAKQRKHEARQNNIDMGPSRKELKKNKLSESPCKTSVIIDLSFDDLMIPKDLGKVTKQILRVYTENRRSKTPMQLHMTSFDGKSKAEMAKHSGYENWDCYFHSEHYTKIFPKKNLVYLTSDSDNVIRELEQDKMYIIGGLVDHNSHKGLCYRRAVEEGISHGQLPISEFFTVKTRKVFTINQVFEILLKVSDGMSFKEAFQKVLPQRINIVPNESGSDIGE